MYFVAHDKIPACVCEYFRLICKQLVPKRIGCHQKYQQCQKKIAHPALLILIKKIGEALSLSQPYWSFYITRRAPM